MSAQLASVSTYLLQLPGGVDAHPECCVKASLLRNAMGGMVLGPEVPLPAVVRALLDHPPPVSSWVPEVHFNVIMMAIHEVHFGRGQADAYAAWVYQQNRKLLSTALYRALFLLVSPERLLVGMEKRWGTFRKGTELSSTLRSDHDVEVLVRCPPYLYAPVAVESMCSALRAAVDCAGGRRTQIDGEHRSPAEVAYRIRWS
jgi:uncharacterized protein (TIGR02265 family)